LRHWFDRFSANADAVEALYDAQFVRMWRFYLAASEQTFRHGHQAVFQFQLSRSVDAVPLTRDYLYQPLGAALSDGRKPVPTRGPGHNGDRPGI
jgi:cyclopropane-fatty-acyl-phospholipid synthase